MRAILYEDQGKVAFGEYPDPHVQEAGDAVVRVSTAAICGSDLHVIEGRLPGVRPGSVLGHEYTGEVVETGSDVRRFKNGDRVVGSFPIVCGACWYCKRDEGTNCEDLRVLGYGMFVGDLDGAQAEYVRVPNADSNLHAIDPVLSDEQAIFAGDIMSTGLYIAEKSKIRPGDTVAVIGAGPVGLFATMFALTYEPSAVYTVDLEASRLKFAEQAGAIPVDASKVNPVVEIQRVTNDRGADVVIECVGFAKTFQMALDAVRAGGTVGVIGVHTDLEVPFPLGEVWRRNITIVMGGSANVQGVWTRALDGVREGRLDPTVIITHTLPLDEGVRGYEMFRNHEALKVILKP
ncbi:MAG: alcohol dehydrogenase catalytic domain-containing protein [Actinomycetota bacterium]|nr:alcohol dehydrogenase catalytic domain-containing protein [Actinomycetota bacterium]